MELSRHESEGRGNLRENLKKIPKAIGAVAVGILLAITPQVGDDAPAHAGAKTELIGDAESAQPSQEPMITTEATAAVPDPTTTAQGSNEGGPHGPLEGEGGEDPKGTLPPATTQPSETPPPSSEAPQPSAKPSTPPATDPSPSQQVRTNNPYIPTKGTDGDVGFNTGVNPDERVSKVVKALLGGLAAVGALAGMARSFLRRRAEES